MSSSRQFISNVALKNGNLQRHELNSERPAFGYGCEVEVAQECRRDKPTFIHRVFMTGLLTLSSVTEPKSSS